ncbi:MAG: amidohydrolase/deacetylase family metallohydrolase [Thermodesulfobacteriota bacterium]
MVSHDLLIKGGRVIDPAQSLDGVMDVAVSNGKIAGVMPNIPPDPGGQVINAAGKIVTPGLIDMHAHVYHGFLNNGADPEMVGVNQGVTTVVDGGSAGHAIFEGFPKYVIPATRTSVYCFLHIGSFGLSVMPELWYPEEIDTASTEAVMMKYPDLIKGVKIRLVGKLIAHGGDAVVTIAKNTAKKLRLPLMVHIGDRAGWISSALVREILPLLEAGDILSHFYTAQPGSVLGVDGRAIPELLEARDRGVVLDVAAGVSNLAYFTARTMMAQGILPTTITTDATRSSVTGPVYGLTVTMSKFLELGLSLEKILPMVTINPARVIGIDDRKGSLKPGRDADISVLDIENGRWRFPDSHEGVLNVTRLIRPVMTVKAGLSIPPKCMPINEEYRIC